MAQEPNELYHHTIFISSDEKVDTCPTKAGHQEQHDAHTHIDGKNAQQRQHEIDGDAGCPEPKVGKDVHHGKEQYAGSGALRADVWLQLHDFVRLASHQSRWSGIVEGKACDGKLQYLPKGDRALARTTNDDAPRPRVHDVEKDPQTQDGDEPITRMTNVCPELGKRHLERKQHHDDRDESKGKEDVAGFVFQFSSSWSSFNLSESSRLATYCF